MLQRQVFKIYIYRNSKKQLNYKRDKLKNAMDVAFNQKKTSLHAR